MRGINHNGFCFHDLCYRHYTSADSGMSYRDLKPIYRHHVDAQEAP
jgi:hypothetical protein